MEMLGIDPRTYRMQSDRSTTELHPRRGELKNVCMHFVKLLVLLTNHNGRHTCKLMAATLKYCFAF